mgnify:CR=1 FL=1
MKLAKHNVSSIAVGFPRDVLVSALSEAINLINDCKVMRETLQNLKDGKADEYDVADLLEDYSIFGTESLSVYRQCNTSDKIEVNKYLNRVFTDLEVLKKRLNSAIDVMCCIEKDEIESLMKSLYKVISGFLYFVLIEFNVFECLSENGTVKDDAEVDEILASYCKRENTAVGKLVDQLYGLSKEFVPKLDIFDSYPELEEPFQSIMGPSSACLDEKFLTLDMIKQVIDGTLSPDDLAQTILAMEIEEDQTIQ